MKKETRKIGKEPKKIVLSLSKENIILRAIIAGVCLFLGVVLIVNGCSKMLNKSQYLVLDYPDFEDENGVTSTLFDGNVDLNYYYLMGEEEDSRSIVMNKIDTILNDNMVNIHKLCDYNQLYKDGKEYIHNLKYINDNPNTYIKVSDTLYSLLKDADNLRNDTNGKYSIFAGNLYNIWSDVFSNFGVYGNDDSNILLLDPMFDESKKELIDRTVLAINDTSTYLEFNDETKEVKYNVSISNKDYVTLDLGLLETTFYVDTLKKLLLNEGLDSGYISTLDGMVATLGTNKNNVYWGFDSYSYQTIFNVDFSTIYDYSFTFLGQVNYMSFNPLMNIKNHSYASKNYYFFNYQDYYYVRSMILDSTTGYSSDTTHSSFTFSDKSSLCEQLKDNYNLFFNDFKYNNDYLLKYEDNKNYGAIVMFNNGNTNIEFNGNTTMLYSKLVDSYFDEEYIPYVELSDVVKAKIVATKGE